MFKSDFSPNFSFADSWGWWCGYLQVRGGLKKKKEKKKKKKKKKEFETKRGRDNRIDKNWMEGC